MKALVINGTLKGEVIEPKSDTYSCRKHQPLELHPSPAEEYQYAYSLGYEVYHIIRIVDRLYGVKQEKNFSEFDYARKVIEILEENFNANIRI